MFADRPKRRRARPATFQADPLNAREEKMLRLALDNSRVVLQRENVDLPPAPVFRPTKEEFSEPLSYISKIREELQKTGIGVIVPPMEWNPEFAVPLKETRTFETKLQQIHRLQEGIAFEQGRDFTFAQYYAMAMQKDEQLREDWTLRGRPVTPESIEEEFWRIVESGETQVEIEYASDVDTTQFPSGFEKRTCEFAEEAEVLAGLQDPQYYRKTGWNLNNISKDKGSILSHIQVDITGVHVPWLYLGALFTAFCWHTEDNYLYSINYMHKGSPKIWYGVPARDGELVEKVMRRTVPERFREDPDLMFHLTTMVHPNTLTKHKINVYRAVQHERQFVITMPKAFHSGLNTGFNCAEAVNFASADWIPFGSECHEKYREFSRSSAFSQTHLLLSILSSFVAHSNSYREGERDRERRKVIEKTIEEVIQMRKEEETLLAELVDQGLQYVIEMPSYGSLLTQTELKTQPNGSEAIPHRLTAASMEEDDRKQCSVCKHVCYLSAIVCRCHSRKIYCLRHAESAEACECELESKYLLQWMSIEELDELLERAQLRLQATAA